MEATRRTPYLKLIVFLSILLSVVSQPILSRDEQESVYRVLEVLNSEVPWRSLFPDDLCSASPHGVVCDYFDDGGVDGTGSVHVTELSLGYVSEYSPNPPCLPSSNISSSLFDLMHLRKLFFYNCFNGAPLYLSLDSHRFGSSLEELVFVDNPSLVGPLTGIMVGNLTRLRRLIVTGTGLYGSIPERIGELGLLEEVTLSRNRLVGELPRTLSALKKLRILDLSGNRLRGDLPPSMGNLSRLLKLDLSSNKLEGVIPECLKRLQVLEFIDLSHNRFSNSGIPLFLGEMPRLREIYLSGNKLGGPIPEIWEKLDGVLRIGLSGLDLFGPIPPSMAVFLRNLCFLGLDNNKLNGSVPREFRSLEFVNEINLENNYLTGRLPFSTEFIARIGHKLKTAGNRGLCVDDDDDEGFVKSNIIPEHFALCNRSNSHSLTVPLLRGVSGATHASRLVTGFIIFFHLAMHVCELP